MYKCCYYTCAGFFGWLTLKDSYILPPGFGGSGSLWQQFRDFPYIQHPYTYRFYFTGTMGYHIGGLLNHFFAKKKHNDYIEMMFHHIVTAYLYAFSYMTNTLIGAVVAFLHDCPDMVISWTRVWAETEHARVTAYSFAVAQCLWFYMRIYWLSQAIWVSTVRLEVYA
jgi:TLC domain